MRMHRIAAAALGACLLSGGAWAQSATDARLEALERRIQQLEERLAERDAAMAEKEQALAKLQAKVAVQEQTAADISARVEESGGGWTEGLEIGGAVEVEIVHDKPWDKGEKSTSNAETATVELALTAQINDSTSVELLVDKDDDDKVEVDVAAITIGMEEAPVSFTAGKILLPFADFGTELVSDPMAFELSEAHKTVLQIGFESGGLAGSVYAFNGDADYGGKDRIGDFGVQADYGIELGGIAFDAGVGWLSDVRESYKAEELRPDGGDWPGDRKKVAGLAVSAGLGFGPLSFSGHYMTARDNLEELDINFVGEPELPESFADGTPVSGDAVDSGGSALSPEAAFSYSYAGREAQPSAYGVEAAYAVEMGDREVVFAAGWQRTREAFGLEMPESRVLFGFSTELVEGVGIALEYARHKDYGAMTCGATYDGADGGHIEDPDNAGTYIPLPASASFDCGGTGRNGSTVTLQLAAEF